MLSCQGWALWDGPFLRNSFQRSKTQATGNFSPLEPQHLQVCTCVHWIWRYKGRVSCRFHIQTASKSKRWGGFPLSFAFSVWARFLDIHNEWILQIHHTCKSLKEGLMGSAHYSNKLCIEYHSKLNLLHHSLFLLLPQKNHPHLSNIRLHCDDYDSEECSLS